ncbi:MAG: PilZ domain-containing protein [Lawsonibacter sp.]|nr:PilZ domain-containing protein [Lawsonibacter sp.]
MGFLDFFRKPAKTEPVNAAEQDSAEDTVYSGMRVEVTTLEGKMLFAGKLANLRDGTAELYQYIEGELPQSFEPIPVKIRGYNDRTRKAVFMDGTITQKPKHVWQVDGLVVTSTGNDRAFFRLDTNLDATATTFRGVGAGEKPCKLLNISVGGACIGSQYLYHTQDTFLLKVKLLEDRDVSTMFCQILRITVRGEGNYEYGCRFLELNETDQEKITQNIFAVQRKKRGSS